MSSVAPSCLSPSEGYRLWAESYDQQANPMLSLEQRIMEPLLPDLAGLDVVDIGCGTGRWLHALKRSGAGSLTGVDLSKEMLGRAQKKLPDVATFVCADYKAAAIARASADLVLCNFVLSYVGEPLKLLRVVKSILRPAGSFFLSDLHPDTATALKWRRGIPGPNGFREIRTQPRAMSEVVALCGEAGFAVRVHLEPRFGKPERLIFQHNGKGHYFEQVRNYPAIYVLQLTPSGRVDKRPAAVRENKPGIIDSLYGGRFAFGPTESACAEIHIHGSHVGSLLSSKDCEASLRSEGSSVDLPGYLALPGLINAHDHLEFALYPRLGKGGYGNFLEWAEDIQHSHASEIACHRRVPKPVRLWWGGIRNLLCGVTTVCHHNPFEPEIFTDDFVVRVLEGYGWAHSVPLDPAAAKKRNKTPKGQPFLIHLAEGTDEQSAKEIFELARAGALDEDTVIIHGLGLGAKGSTLLRSVGAGLIWCPSSNQFLFGRSMSPDEIREFPKVALGSDSPLTARGDLLDEIRYAHQELRAPAGELYRYVTRSSASLLRLTGGEGTVRVGGTADLVVVRDVGLSPADTLARLSFLEIELVVLRGRVQLASEGMRRRLPQSAYEGLQPLSVEGTVRWIRAPLDRLFAETSVHLHGPLHLAGKRVSLAR